MSRNTGLNGPKWDDSQGPLGPRRSGNYISPNNLTLSITLFLCSSPKAPCEFHNILLGTSLEYRHISTTHHFFNSLGVRGTVDLMLMH